MVFAKEQRSKRKEKEILLFLSLLAEGIDIETQTLSVEVDLVVALLQDGSNISGVLKLAELNVTAALLDGVTDELGGAGLTLGADDHGLLFLAGLVDDESGALSFLLSDLLGFDCGGELGREGEVLGRVKSQYGVIF